MNPTVSVIIPTFNRPKLCYQAVESVLEQSYSDFEIIVVNDAGEPLQEITELDSRVRYLSHKSNSGLAASRNTGIRAARGELLSYLDDDDRFYPDHLGVLVSQLKASEHLVAYSDAFAAKQRLVNGQLVTESRDLVYSEEFSLERMITSNFIPVLCVVHHRSCLARSGRFDTTLKRTEDWDFWIRLGMHYPFKHIRQVTCEYSWREDGSTMTSNSRDAFDWAELNIYHRYRSILPSSSQARLIVDNQSREALERLTNRMIELNREGERGNLNSNPLAYLKAGPPSYILSQLKFLATRYPELSSRFEHLISLTSKLFQIKKIKSC